jgi:23S rRNA (adenine2503-C2)-methyltransferase
MTPATPKAPPPLARTPEEWAEAIGSTGGRPFHGRQIFRWLQTRGVLSAERMTDLPKDLRGQLESLAMDRIVQIADERRSADDTRKLLVRLGDGATVETVLIPGVTGGKSNLPSPSLPIEVDADAAAAVDDDDGEDEGDTAGAATATGEEPVRVTQCISTQVGCAMGCVFCASGVAGLKRQLGPDEIVGQVLLGRTRLDANERLRNVVYMGMGEPLHNYDATARSLRLLTHREGIGLSARRVTVSTSGLVPEIARLGEDFAGNIGLAISLHAADDETRSRLMPINKKYPLPVLMDALRAYPLPRRRRITIEYTLVAGKNDAPEEAKKLARLLRGIPVKVNLIPMNPISASSLEPPPVGRVLEFQQILCDAGYACFVRKRRGDDVSAACGQLALLGAKPKVRVNRM